MPAGRDGRAGLPCTPNPARLDVGPDPQATPLGQQVQGQGGQLMFSRGGAGPRHGAVEGDVGQRWRVCSDQGGGSLVQTQAPQQAVTSVEPAGGAPGGAWSAGWQMAGELGTGEQGRTGDDFQAQMTVASLFKRYK